MPLVKNVLGQNILLSDLAVHPRVMDHSRPLHVQRAGQRAQRQWSWRRRQRGVGGGQRPGRPQPGRAQRPLGERQQGRARRHVGKSETSR